MSQNSLVFGVVALGVLVLLAAAAVQSQIPTGPSPAGLSGSSAQSSDPSYLARMSALDTREKALLIEKRSFEWTVWIFTALSTVIIVLGAAWAWRFGKSFRELNEEVKDEARTTFRREMQQGADEFKEIADLRKSYQEAVQEAEQHARQLKGYADLLNVTGAAEEFDPLGRYYELAAEIKIRREEERRQSDNDDVEEDISKTTKDREFRQRASVVFERLLRDVQEDSKNEHIRVDASTLYNVAANASMIDLDFVALELIELAARIDKKNAPEIESRLIRQRLNMSRIDADQAKEAIAKVIARTSGFDIHLVVSEAFNIGLQTADPVGVAKIVMENIRPELASNSYVLLNNCRLYGRGNGPEDFREAETLFWKGYESLQTDVPTARWHESSQTEFRRVLAEFPHIFEAFTKRMTDNEDEP